MTNDNKSFIAKIAESILKSTKADYMGSLELSKELLDTRLKQEDKPVKSFFKSSKIDGVEVFTFGNKEKSKNTIVYIHGGAFINEINYQHQLYCLLMAKRLDAYVIAPVYPLAPKHSAIETFDLIERLYKSLIEDENCNNLYLMGDSAGGGFALSFCQYLKTINLPQPKEIITFSPWVDVSMPRNDYDNENDPILGEIGLKEVGKSWAGDLDTKDYRVSSIYGDNEGLAKNLIFVGDAEIFYQDVLKFHNNLQESGVESRLVVGGGMFHIYPLFPVPEAWTAFKELKKEFK